MASDVRTEDLLLRIPKERLARLVDGREDSLEVVGVDHVIGVLDQIPVPCLARLESLLGLSLPPP